MPIRGPSVASFLMQAEENLATLGSQLEAPEEVRVVTPRAVARSVHQGPAGGGVGRTAPPPHARSPDLRVRPQSSNPEQTCETLHSLEEQLDIQARSLLGIDRRLRGLEGKLRASLETAGAVAEEHARSLVQEVFHGPVRELEERVNALQAAQVAKVDSPEGIGRREFQVLERRVAEVLLASKRSASAASRSAPSAIVEGRLTDMEAQLNDMAETFDGRRLALVEQRVSDFEVRQRSFFAEDPSSEEAVRVWMRGVDVRLAELEPEHDERTLRTHLAARWEVGAMEERVAAEHSQTSSEILSLQERVAELELSVSRLPARCQPATAAVGTQDPAALQSSMPPRNTGSARSLSSVEASPNVATSHNPGKKGPSKTRSVSASSIASGGLCGLSATMDGLGEAFGGSAPPAGIVHMEVQRLNSQRSKPALVDEARHEDVELSSQDKNSVATAHASSHRLTNQLAPVDSFELSPGANDRLWPLEFPAGDYPVSRDLLLASPRQAPFQGYNDRTSLNTITEAHVASTGEFAVRGEPRKDSGGPWGVDSEASSVVQGYVVPAVSSAGSPTAPGSTTAASTPPAGPSLSASLSASPPEIHGGWLPAASLSALPFSSTPPAEPQAGYPPEIHGGLDPTELLDVFLVDLARGPAESSWQSASPPVPVPATSTAGLAEICARLRDTQPEADSVAALHVDRSALHVHGSLAGDGSSTSTSPTGSLSSLPM